MTNKYFVDEGQKDRIDLGDGQWVDIKSSMSIGDWEKLEQELWQFDTTVKAGQRREAGRFRPGDEGTDQLLRASYKPSTIILLKLNILAWSFDRPLSAENISKLHPATADRLVKEIDGRNPR